MRTHRNNRLLLIAPIAALTLAALSLEAVGVDVTGVRGTVLTGSKPEPSAVVWLEAPSVPESAPQQQS